ncbi:hypothetical protein Lser_V15G32829 [Lactuca serriola]
MPLLHYQTPFFCPDTNQFIPINLSSAYWFGGESLFRDKLFKLSALFFRHQRFLKVGNREDICPCNGRWNFNKKKLFTPIKIEKWVAVNFSAKCDACYLAPELINCGRNRGVVGQSQRFLIAHFH